MKLVYTIGTIKWIDIVGPTDSEIRSIFEEYQFDPAIAEEFLKPLERPKVESYKDYLYLVLHFPRLGNANDDTPRDEVDFLIFHDTLITVHQNSVPLLYEFTKTIEVPGFSKTLPREAHAGHIFVTMVRHFYTIIAIQLDDTSRQLHTIEHNIFNGNEKEMVYALSGASRRLLDLQRAIEFHGDTIKRYAHYARTFFGADYIIPIKKTYFEYQELSRTLNSLKEVVQDLWRTNEALLNTKTNETMRKLTALSFVTLPLSVIVGIFGMNMDFPLIVGYPDFLVVILAMLGVAAGLSAYLQYRKWL